MYTRARLTSSSPGEMTVNMIGTVSHASVVEFVSAGIEPLLLPYVDWHMRQPTQGKSSAD